MTEYYNLPHRGLTRAKESDFLAIDEAQKNGVDFSKDFFAQNVGGIMADLAKVYGYRKPKNANGSTGRYYFHRLQRLLTPKTHYTLKINGRIVK